MTFSLPRTRRSRGLAVVAVASALLIGISGCASSSSGSTASAAPKNAYDAVIAGAPVASADTISGNSWAAAIKKAGVLRTGGTDTGPLFSLKDPVTGKVTGFDAGLSQMLAKYIIGDPKTELTITTVDTRETLIQNDSVDAVFATYSITPQRAEKVAFAGPYYEDGMSIMVKGTTKGISSPKDLAGKTVCTQANSTGVTTLESVAPKAKVLALPDDASCVAALQGGRADAYVIDQAILLSDALKNKELKVVGKVFTSDPYGIGVTRGNPEAKKFVDAWLKKIEASGDWAKLWKATVGTVVEGNAPTPPKIGSVPGS